MFKAFPRNKKHYRSTLKINVGRDASEFDARHVQHLKNFAEINF